MKSRTTFTSIFLVFLLSIIVTSSIGCGNTPRGQETKNQITPQPEESVAPEDYSGGKSPTPIAIADLASDCYDPSQKSDTMCPDLYDPVCGCDNRNYSNPCQAKNAGIKKWTKGNCK